MGQGDVVDKIKGCDGWVTPVEVEEMLGYLSKQSINSSLNRLWKRGLLKRKEDPERNHGFIYKYKG